MNNGINEEYVKNVGTKREDTFSLSTSKTMPVKWKQSVFSGAITVVSARAFQNIKKLNAVL